MDNIMEKFQALSLGEKIILVAGVVLFIVGFLPWYSFDLGPFGSVTRSGWQSPGALWSMLAIFIGLAMSGVITAKTFTDVKLPDDIAGQSWARIHLGGGVIALLFIIIKFLNHTGDLSFGFFIGFLAAAALVVGGGLMFRDEGGTLPGMPSNDGPSGTPPGPADPPSGPPASPPGQ